MQTLIPVGCFRNDDSSYKYTVDTETLDLDVLEFIVAPTAKCSLRTFEKERLPVLIQAAASLPAIPQLHVAHMRKIQAVVPVAA